MSSDFSGTPLTPVRAALTRSTIASSHLTALISMIGLVVTVLVAVVSRRKTVPVFFLGSTTLIAGLLAVVLSLYLYFAWARRRDKLPDLLVPFAVAFCLILVAVAAFSKVDQKLMVTEIRGDNLLNLTDALVIAIILIGVNMAYFMGLMRPDHLISIGITVVAVYVISGLMDYAASNFVATASSATPTSIWAYVIGLFLVFCLSSFLCTLLMDKISGNTGKQPLIESTLKDTIDQQKKLVTVGLLVISVIVSVFFMIHTHAIDKQRETFSMYTAYAAVVAGSVLIPLLAFIASYFHHKSNSLFLLISGIVSGLIVLYLSQKVAWTKEYTGVVFILMGLLLMAVNSSSQFPRTLGAILLSAFALAVAQVVSDGNKPLFLALALFAAGFFAEFGVFGGYGGQTVMFVTFVVLYSISGDFFLPSTTWDTFGQLFCLFIGIGLIVAALRSIVYFLSSEFLKIYGSVFDATSLILTCNVAIVIFITLLMPFVNFFVAWFEKHLFPESFPASPIDN